MISRIELFLVECIRPVFIGHVTCVSYDEMTFVALNLKKNLLKTYSLLLVFLCLMIVFRKWCYLCSL